MLEIPMLANNKRGESD